MEPRRSSMPSRRRRRLRRPKRSSSRRPKRGDPWRGWARDTSGEHRSPGDGVVRREAEEVQPRFEEASQAAREAEDRVKEGRGVEAEARRGLIESRRRLGAALGVLSSLRLVAGEEYRGTEEPFQYLVLVRDRTVLGSLSLDEWAHRASGHSRVARFILEKDGEALWLYRGEWIAADTSLTLDDLAVVDEMTDGTDAPESESPDGRAPSIDLEAIQYTWERFRGARAKAGR